MTVHTKWEILVQKLLKSVELFKSYGLIVEPSENNIFWSKNVIFLTFIKKTENRPLLAHRKGHNF
jgi:hypothetical protein